MEHFDLAREDGYYVVFGTTFNEPGDYETDPDS
jgi:hypothetical protein